MSLMNYRSLKGGLVGVLLVVLVLGGCASQPASYRQAEEARPVQPVAVPEPVAEAVTSEVASISSIAVTEEEDTLRVVINGTEPLTYTVTQMEFPLRLVIDVAGARLDAPAEPIAVDKGVITEITPSQLEGAGETTTRIEVGLNSYMADYEFLPSGNDLFIDFVKPQPLKAAEHILDVTVSESGEYVQVDVVADGTIAGFNSFSLEGPSRLVLDFPGLKALGPITEKESSSGLLQKVRYGEHGEYARIVLDCPLPEMPPFEAVSTAQGVAVFLGSGFEGKKEAMIAKGSSSPVGEEGDAGVSTEGEEPVALLAKAEDAEKGGAFDESNPGGSFAEEPPEGSMTSSEMEESGEAANPGEGAAEASPEVAAFEGPMESSGEGAEASASMGEETAEEEAGAAESADASFEAAETMEEVGVEEAVEEEIPAYTGTRIDLDFKNADIKNVLRLIAEVSNLNIVAGDDVEGTVTIRLTDVPWDQALDMILLSNNLGKSLEGNILRIAPMDRLNREKLAAVQVREAQRKVEPLRKALIPVSYADADDLKNVIANSEVLSSRGSIEIDARTNTMIVIDIEENIREVQRIIDQLDTPTPQVLIEAKIVQIAPSYTKELGITWESGYATTHGNDGLIGIGGSGGVDIDLGEGTVNPKGTIVDLAPAVGPGVGGAISWGYLSPTFGIGGKIAALEKEEKAEIVSSPRIMTLDNEEASIEQGADIPYLKASEEGVPSVEYKKVTLSLKVKPHVTVDGSISMEIFVKKEQVSAQTGSGGEPGIDTRRAENKVLVRNGHTVVIGGVYEENMTDGHNSVPFLGRVPLVGFFFKSTTTRRDKVELLVFITPTIVRLPKKAPDREMDSGPLS